VGGRGYRGRVTLEELARRLFADGDLIAGTLSKPRHKAGGLTRVTVRPVDLRDGLRYQFAHRLESRELSENLSSSDAEHRLLALLGPELRQGLLHTAHADYQVLAARDGEMKILERPPTRAEARREHDRPKAHVLREGDPAPFLIALGVMTRDGKVRAARRDKFRQINRFLELVADVAGRLPRDRPAEVVDFGCGKSYLTFALYHYLRDVLGLDVRLRGIDRKEDVVAHCRAVAGELGYDAIEFEVGDIAAEQRRDAVDMVVALHACDTATDDALAQAVRWGADVILAVPCCQHELLAQMEGHGALAPLLRHGIVKERVAALATDAMRAQLLELAGYSTQIVEFVEPEATAKNLMIRAVRRGRAPRPDVADAYRELRDSLGASPALERALHGLVAV
jgi:SAM-dependent methyltransferase